MRFLLPPSFAVPETFAELVFHGETPAVGGLRRKAAGINILNTGQWIICWFAWSEWNGPVCGKIIMITLQMNSHSSSRNSPTTLFLCYAQCESSSKRFMSLRRPVQAVQEYSRQQKGTCSLWNQSPAIMLVEGNLRGWIPRWWKPWFHVVPCGSNSTCWRSNWH